MQCLSAYRTLPAYNSDFTQLGFHSEYPPHLEVAAGGTRATRAAHCSARVAVCQDIHTQRCATQRSARVAAQEAATYAMLCNTAHITARRDNTHNTAQCTHRSATGSNTHSAAQCSTVPASHRRTQCAQHCATQCSTHITASRDATHNSLCNIVQRMHHTQRAHCYTTQCSERKPANLHSMCGPCHPPCLCTSHTAPCSCPVCTSPQHPSSACRQSSGTPSLCVRVKAVLSHLCARPSSPWPCTRPAGHTCMLQWVPPYHLHVVSKPGLRIQVHTTHCVVSAGSLDSHCHRVPSTGGLQHTVDCHSAGSLDFHCQNIITGRCAGLSAWPVLHGHHQTTLNRLLGTQLTAH